VIDIYRQTIDELARSIQALEREEAVLADFIEQNSIEQEKLNAIRDEKINLLARVRTQTSLHEQAIAELEDAGRSLDESIGNLKQEKEMVDQSFARSRGKLPPPVAGTVIVGYDQQWTNRLGITRVSKGNRHRGGTGNHRSSHPRRGRQFRRLPAWVWQRGYYQSRL
jgi:septal ring factor EnvC (AmiA/AmiB activator)